jgi:hypothetical protein
MQIQLSEAKTNYHGRKVGVAVVTLNGRRVELGLADTTRCAQSRETATRVLVNLGNLATVEGEEDEEINGAAVQLHAHCRKVLGFKDAAA